MDRAGWLALNVAGGLEASSTSLPLTAGESWDGGNGRDDGFDRFGFSLGYATSFIFELECLIGLLVCVFVLVEELWIGEG